MEGAVRKSFSVLYKNNGRLAQTQEERRQSLLKTQKEKRCESFDENRHLEELINNFGIKSHKGHKKKKKESIFKLMEAEWLHEIPIDLNENWLAKICPLGIRYLVVAKQGCTTCFYRNNKNYNASFKFKSFLPGGEINENINNVTILDCIYSEESNCLLVFDVLVWNSLPLINCEAQFRFYWIKSKFEELAHLQSDNRYIQKLYVMDAIAANRSIIQECLHHPYEINNVEIHFEGILFYHKEGLYTFHRTPLVNWLKCCMLTEKLGIDIDDEISKWSKPKNYINFDQHLENKKNKKHKIKKKVTEQEIEMEDIEYCGEF